MTYPLEFFKQRVSQDPEATAVVCGAVKLTLAELDQQSSQLAHLLQSRGLQSGEALGILLNKDVRTVVAMLAAWKLGSPYVPLDAKAPLQRISYMLDRCRIRFAVADGALRDTLSPALEKVSCVWTEPGPQRAGEVWGPLAGVSTDFVPAPLSGEAIAYVIFTSGTTGVPKGVAITHANLGHFIQWCRDALELQPRSRALNIADMSFDQSVMDLAFMLGSGVELHLYASFKDPISLSTYISRNRIQILSTVPTTFGMFFDERFGLGPEMFATIERAFVGGAACPAPYVHAFHRMMPGARVYNMYGPTEVTVYCLFHEFTQEELRNGVETVSLGKPLPGHFVRLLDEQGRVAQERGELFVFGPQVMKGYWGDTQKTEAVLRTDEATGAKGYKTGDIVQYTASGSLTFVGRADDTIKSGGYRIDLGEIESALIRSAKIVQVAAVAIPDQLLQNTIHAFIVRAEGAELSERDALAICLESIPAYMQPHQFHFLPALPLNSSGKIDKKKLAALPTQSA